MTMSLHFSFHEEEEKKKKGTLDIHAYVRSSSDLQFFTRADEVFVLKANKLIRGITTND